jgi:flagellar basal body-associated protein FliL
MSRFLGIFCVVLFSLTAVAATSFFVTTKTLDSSSNRQAKAVIVNVGNPKESSIVNILGTSAYLKYNISIEVDENLYEKSEGKALSKMDIIIQDTINQTLRVKNSNSFKPENQNILREEIKKNINKALKKEVVLNVYITNFVIGF